MLRVILFNKLHWAMLAASSLGKDYLKKYADSCLEKNLKVEIKYLPKPTENPVENDNLSSD
jgi:hypothetical protein